MSDFTFDDVLENKIEKLREIGRQHAEAKKTLSYLEHSRKILLARLMKEYQLNSNTGKFQSAVSQEREALSDIRYEKHIDSLSEAVKIESELNWQKQIVHLNHERWKVKMFAESTEKKHYG